jgi:MFS family permease
LGQRYWLLLTAYIVSNAGTWIYRLTLPLLVLHLTGSALQTAALYALEYGPFLLLSLPGGVWADRFDRKRLLIGGDVAAGVIALALAIVVSTGSSALPALYLLAFLLACVEPIYHPAFQGLLPSIVADSELDRANSLMQSSDQIISLAGPVLAGGLVALFGYSTSIYIDAASFAGSALVLLFLKRGKEIVAPEPIRRTGFFGDLAEAFRYIVRENRLLLIGSLLFTGTNFGIWLIQANLVYYLSTYLGLSSALIGMVFAAQGVGALGGALLAPAVIRRLGNGRTIVCSTMAAGLLTGLLVVFRDVVGVAIVSAVVFALGSMNVVSWFTLRQRIVPQAMLGRVVAATRMLAFSSIPLAAIVAGVAEDALHDMYLVILAGAALRFLVGFAGSRTSLVRSRAGTAVSEPASS